MNTTEKETTVIDSFLLGFKNDRRNTADTMAYTNNMLSMKQDDTEESEDDSSSLSSDNSDLILPAKSNPNHLQTYDDDSLSLNNLKFDDHEIDELQNDCSELQELIEDNQDELDIYQLNRQKIKNSPSDINLNLPSSLPSSARKENNNNTINSKPTTSSSRHNSANQHLRENSLSHVRESPVITPRYGGNSTSTSNYFSSNENQHNSRCQSEINTSSINTYLKNRERRLQTSSKTNSSRNLNNLNLSQNYNQSFLNSSFNSNATSNSKNLSALKSPRLILSASCEDSTNDNKHHPTSLRPTSRSPILPKSPPPPSKKLHNTSLTSTTTKNNNKTSSNHNSFITSSSPNMSNLNDVNQAFNLATKNIDNRLKNPSTSNTSTTLHVTSSKTIMQNNGQQHNNQNNDLNQSKNNLLDETRITRSVINDQNKNVTNLTKQLSDLQKENFRLKLRINYMQEDLDKLTLGLHDGSSGLSNYNKENNKKLVDLQISNDEKERELKENQEQLTRALAVIKQLQESQTAQVTAKQANEIARQEQRSMTLLNELNVVNENYQKSMNEVNVLKHENKNYYFMKEKYETLERQLKITQEELADNKVLLKTYSDSNKRYQSNSLNEAQSNFSDLLTSINCHKQRNQILEDENKTLRQKYEDQINQLQLQFTNQRKISQDNELDYNGKVRNLTNELSLITIKYEKEVKLRKALENKASSERITLENKDENISRLSKQLEANRSDLVSLNNKLNFYERQNLDLLSKIETLKAEKQSSLEDLEALSNVKVRLRKDKNSATNHYLNEESSSYEKDLGISLSSPRNAGPQGDFDPLGFETLNKHSNNTAKLKSTNEILEKRLNLANQRIQELAKENHHKSNIEEKYERVKAQYEKKVRELAGLRNKYENLIKENTAHHLNLPNRGTVSGNINTHPHPGTTATSSSGFSGSSKATFSSHDRHLKSSSLSNIQRLENDYLDEITTLKNKIKSLEEEVNVKSLTINELKNSKETASPRTLSARRYADHRRWSDRIVRSPNGNSQYGSTNRLNTSNALDSPMSNKYGQTSPFCSQNNLSPRRPHSGYGLERNISSENSNINAAEILHKENTILKEQLQKFRQKSNLLSNQCKELIECTQLALQNKAFGLLQSNDQHQFHGSFNSLDSSQILLQKKVDGIKELLIGQNLQSISNSMVNLSQPQTPQKNLSSLNFNLGSLNNIKKHLFQDSETNSLINNQNENIRNQQAEINRLKAHNQLLANQLLNQEKFEQQKPSRPKFLNGRLTPSDDNDHEDSPISNTFESHNSRSSVTADVFTLDENASLVKIFIYKHNYEKMKKHISHSLVTLKILKSKMREILNKQGLLYHKNQEMDDFEDVELSMEKTKKMLDDYFMISSNHNSQNQYASRTTLNSEGLNPVLAGGTTTSGIGTHGSYTKNFHSNSSPTTTENEGMLKVTERHHTREKSSNSAGYLRFYRYPDRKKSTNTHQSLKLSIDQDLDGMTSASRHDLNLNQQNSPAKNSNNSTLKRRSRKMTLDDLENEMHQLHTEREEEQISCRTKNGTQTTGSTVVDESETQTIQGDPNQRQKGGLVPAASAGLINSNDNNNNNLETSDQISTNITFMPKSETLHNLNSINRQNTKDILREELQEIKLRLKARDKQLRKTSHELVKSNKIKTALENSVTKKLMEIKGDLQRASENMS